MSGKIRALTPSFGRAGTAIAEVVISAPLDVMTMTVTDLAAHTGTSVGSVIRFCQDLGFKGFQDLKLSIAAESSPRGNTAKGDVKNSIHSLLINVLESSAKAVRDVESTIDLSILEQAVISLTQANRVLVVGVGTSAPLAQDAAYRFRGIGVLAEFPVDALNQHAAANLLTPGDVCLAVSHTGQTRETLAAVSAAGNSGATTIAVTSFSRSPLTDLCTMVLVAGSQETEFRVEAMASRFSHLAVLDALHDGVAQRHPNRAAQAGKKVAEAISEHRL